MQRQQQQLILRLWKEWCRVWPVQYGHESLEVKADGYDPVFDVVPSQTYKDFYFEVVRGHPQLRNLNAFEVVDAALNQTRAPEATVPPNIQIETQPEPVPQAVVQHIEPRVVEVELEALPSHAQFEEASKTGTSGG